MERGRGSFIASVILFIICLVAEFFAVLFGVESLNLILYPTQDMEGIALIVLLPMYLMIAGGILVVSIISIILNNVCIRNYYKEGSSKFMLTMNILMNIANIIMFVMMITNGN